MYRSFGDIIADKRILVCVGSGGVGKTTTAAALALEGARRGKRTLVITIDPARRLANSLGLASLGHEAKEVPSALIDGAGPRQPGGELHAMMLDQKRAFDEIVARYASDPAAVQRILDNPIYAQISGTLAGSQEYAAMAKLHELDAEGGWDLIVVDTPPTAHALDFLDAPEKLTSAIDSPAIEWFRKLRGQERSGWAVVGRSGAYVLKRLAKFVGTRFLDDLALFFTEFNDILGGFKSRAEDTFALLRQDKVGFVLVASPEPMAMHEAVFFYQRLQSSSMPFVGFVVNKVHDDLPIDIDPAELERRAAALAEIAALGVEPTTLHLGIEALCLAHAELQALAGADKDTIAELLEVAGGHPLLVRVPFFREDIHDIGQLGRLGRYVLTS